jgi:hypothetical protein
MRSQLTILFVVVSSAVSMSACGGPAPANSNNAVANAANAVKTNTNSPLDTTKAPV